MTTFSDDPGVALMLAYQGGDEGAFDRLVHDYAGRVYGLLTRFLGEVPQREDLVQEVFLRVIRARERYEPSARFSTWLYRIAFNLAAHERERRSASTLSLEGLAGEEEAGLELAAEVEAPSAALEREDVSSAVRDALDALPGTQRMAMVLARFEGLSHAEIAEVIGSTEKAVKSLMHRARTALRASLAPFLEDGLQDGLAEGMA